MFKQAGGEGLPPLGLGLGGRRLPMLLDHTREVMEAAIVGEAPIQGPGGTNHFAINRARKQADKFAEHLQQQQPEQVDGAAASSRLQLVAGKTSVPADLA